MDQTERLGRLSDIHIILDHPQLAENIGMAARAMVNTGMYNLRLVAPQCGWPNEKINLASAEKLNFLNIEIFNSTEESISDLQFVFATTARNRYMVESIYTPAQAARKITMGNEKIGILFGNEKSGLANSALSLCNGVIEIPSVNFSSYNLAQAVLIICFEILKNCIDAAENLSDQSPKFKKGESEIASQGQLEFFLKKLEENLKMHKHFPTPEKQIQMMQTIRNFFKRAQPTNQEVQSLFGVMNSLLR